MAKMVSSASEQSNSAQVEEPPDDSIHFILMYECLKDLNWMVDSHGINMVIEGVRSSLVSIEEKYLGDSLRKNAMLSTEKSIIGQSLLCDGSDSLYTKAPETLKAYKQKLCRADDNIENFDESYRIQSDMLHKMKLQRIAGSSKMFKLTKNNGYALGCAVCNEIVEEKCEPCYQNYHTFIDLNKKGVPLPECNHKDFNRAAKCKSCKFWKLISIKEKENAGDCQENECKNSAVEVDCPVCKKRTKDSYMKGWRCKDCYSFEIHLVEMHKGGKHLPACSHKGGKILENCKGCCRYNIQTLWPTFTPGKPVELPDYPEIPFDSQNNHEMPQVRRSKIEVCPVCGQMTSLMVNWRCKSCYQFENQLILKHANGKELPVCYHKGERLYMGCLGCRHFHLRTQWKHNNPGKVLQLPPYPGNLPEDSKLEDSNETWEKDRSNLCAICGRKSHFMKLWCCMSCYLLKMQLVRMYREGKDLPECDHTGKRENDCYGCFRRLLHIKWVVHAPDEPLELPPYPLDLSRNNIPMTCPVCRAMTEAKAMVDWRCQACHRFEMLLRHLQREGVDLPDCKHKGSHVISKCKGCLRYCLQAQWNAYNSQSNCKQPLFPGNSLGVESIEGVAHPDQCAALKICPVCSNLTSEMREWRCANCAHFESVLEKQYKEGKMLPICDHEDDVIKKNCRGCHRYLLEKNSMIYASLDSVNIPPLQEPDTHFKTPILSDSDTSNTHNKNQKGVRKAGNSNLKRETCKVCQQRVSYLKNQRCAACSRFKGHLTKLFEKGIPLPKCLHNGMLAGKKCRGCRRFHLEKQMRIQGNCNIPWLVADGQESKDEGSRAVCPVCAKQTDVMIGWRCQTCANYEKYLRRKYLTKRPLPSCKHKGNNMSAGCPGCRRYHLMIQREIHTPNSKNYLPPVTNNDEQSDTCPVCLMKRRMKDWKCVSCFNFENRLKVLFVNGKKLCTCTHRGAMIEKCAGCRRYRLEECWKKNYAHEPYPLPSMMGSEAEQGQPFKPAMNNSNTQDTVKVKEEFDHEIVAAAKQEINVEDFVGNNDSNIVWVPSQPTAMAGQSEFPTPSYAALESPFVDQTDSLCQELPFDSEPSCKKEIISSSYDYWEVKKEDLDSPIEEDNVPSVPVITNVSSLIDVVKSEAIEEFHHSSGGTHATT